MWRWTGVHLLKIPHMIPTEITGILRGCDFESSSDSLRSFLRGYWDRCWGTCFRTRPPVHHTYGKAAPTTIQSPQEHFSAGETMPCPPWPVLPPLVVWTSCRRAGMPAAAFSSPVCTTCREALVLHRIPQAIEKRDHQGWRKSVRRCSSQRRFTF